MVLEGDMRHILGTTAKVRETFHFTGSQEFHVQEFRAIWEVDSGDGWERAVDRTCTRT